MLKSLARKWARFVNRDSRSIVPSLSISTTGVVFISLYIVEFVSSEIFLGLGILVLLTGLHLFERLGLLLLLDEKERSGPTAEPREETGESEQ